MNVGRTLLESHNVRTINDKEAPYRVQKNPWRGAEKQPRNVCKLKKKPEPSKDIYDPKETSTPKKTHQPLNYRPGPKETFSSNDIQSFRGITGRINGTRG
mmetsp:Transcript_16663/g.37474  ORF Transcript_16663/g.37474 Transcript_16663/m.37474 type:complete len:100 (+) Transcript_16663:474-773(+)